MNLRTKLASALTLTLLTVASLPAHGFPLLGKKKPDAKQSDVRPLTADQKALIAKAVVSEKIVVEELKKRTPLVETYIQNMKPDPVMGAVPESDKHFLGRVDFSRVINDKSYGEEKRSDSGTKQGVMSKFKNSLTYITHLSGSLHLTYKENGFVQMLLVDSNSFNTNTYTFTYYKGGFLGTVPVSIFDVAPSKKGPKAEGRFAGRIYVINDPANRDNPENGKIVRFNGSFNGGQADISEFFHFDSWRTNIHSPDPKDDTKFSSLWLPYSCYIEETDPKDPAHTLKFKAINYIWGYSLKVPQDENSTSVKFGDNVSSSPQAQVDDTPLGAQRHWVQEAEDNVIDRLFEAGLIDAGSQDDSASPIERDVLGPLANVILADNNVQIDRPIRVRILLTEPLESLAIGNTILLSRGLVDTSATLPGDFTTEPPKYTPGKGSWDNWNAMLAFQLAHIVLGHHIDTKYAFSDRLLFPSESAFERLPMYHTDADNITAAKKAMEWLGNDKLKDGQQYFSLYLQALLARAKGLKALNEPQIGDSLFKPDGTFWMQAILTAGPKLDNGDLHQTAALPLGSHLKVDPWTDKVAEEPSQVDLILSPRDKYPFEVLPVSHSLDYYHDPTPPAAAPAAATAPATGAATTTAAGDATAAASGSAPATATGTSTPPADTTTAPAGGTTTTAPTGTATGTPKP